MRHGTQARLLAGTTLIGLAASAAAAGQEDGEPWPNYGGGKPFVIAFPVELRAHRSLGGLFVHDVDGDGLMEYVVSVPGQIAVFDGDGRLLWRQRTAQRLRAGAAAGENLPGSNHPGVFAIGSEIGFVTSGGEIVVHDERSGEVLRRRGGFDGAQVALAARFTGAAASCWRAAFMQLLGEHEIPVIDYAVEDLQEELRSLSSG